MKLKSLIVAFVIISSCTNSEVEKQNEKLRKQNDSLRSIMSDNVIRPFVDNKTFVTKKDSTYELQLFAAILRGVTLDTILINGKYVNPNDETVRIKYDDFGPIISFTSDTTGEFEFNVQAKIKAWNNYETNVSWPLIVE